jgi:hypothetical protein
MLGLCLSQPLALLCVDGTRIIKLLQNSTYVVALVVK